MHVLPFSTVDVFTNTRFGENPLAVVTADDALDSDTMQAIAAELNLSGTTFILPPQDAGNTARVRIFDRTAEMAFAGHPMVGTAFVLASQQPRLHAATFEIPAGVARVEIDRDADGGPTAASIAAPQPLSIGETVAPEMVAATLQLGPADVVTINHPPTTASNGTFCIIAESTPDPLSRCEPSLPAFKAALGNHPHFGNRFPVHVYCHDRGNIRARMFAPLSGTWEDPATGSANAPPACFLLWLDPDARQASFEVLRAKERPARMCIFEPSQHPLPGRIFPVLFPAASSGKDHPSDLAATCTPPPPNHYAALASVPPRRASGAHRRRPPDVRAARPLSRPRRLGGEGAGRCRGI